MATINTLNDIINQAEALIKSHKIDSGLDMLLDYIDSMLWQSEFDIISSCLDALDVKAYSVDILLALLMTTNPAKSKIKSRSRSSFYDRVNNEIEDRKEMEPYLLDGLK